MNGPARVLHPLETLPSLRALGIELPSPAYLIGALLFGLVGLGAFSSGRKTGHPRTRWLGLALMLYPYAVSSTWLLYVVGAALCMGIYVDQRGLPW